MISEQWSPICGYEGRYEVSDAGRIRRIAPGRRTKPGHVLSPTVPKKGYKTVKLYDVDHRFKSFTVHGLVAAAFIGSRPEGLEVNHKDGDKMNNAAVNLEYTNRLGNAKHAAAAKRYREGERVTNSKLTRELVLKMRALEVEGWTQARLAQTFGVAQATVWAILRRKWWKHV